MADETETRHGFLQRWSRRKHEVGRAADAPAEPQATPAVPAAASAQQAAPAPAEATSLPPVASLTIESDFTPFLSSKVEETVKRAALRKLFSDPHFNVMDGLDIYIDDYSKPDPMPEGLLDKLADVYKTLEEKAAEVAPPDSVAALETPTVVASDAPTAADPPATHADEDQDEHRG